MRDTLRAWLGCVALPAFVQVAMMLQAMLRDKFAVRTGQLTQRGQQVQAHMHRALMGIAVMVFKRDDAGAVMQPHVCAKTLAQHVRRHRGVHIVDVAQVWLDKHSLPDLN